MISEGTLQAEDKIDGGAGNDTLRVDMKEKFTGLTSGSIKNVENIELINSSNADLEFVASKIEGATKYVVTDAVDKDTTISDLASLADIEISGTADTNHTKLKVIYNAASTVATGSQTDVQNLKVTNQGSINTKTDGTTDAKFMTVDIAKVETLAITTAGTANSLDLSASADVKTVTVAGEGQTEIKAVSATVTSFDASASTGNVIADLKAAATGALTSVKTGAGNDKITVSLDDLTASATVAGGAGTDTLVVDAFTTTKQLTMSGVETVKLNTVTAINGGIFSGTNVTDLANVEVKTGALAGNVQFVNMGAKDLTVTTLGAVTKAGTQTLSADNSGAITVNMNKSAETVVVKETSTVDLTFANASSLTANINEYQTYSGTLTTGTTGAVKLNVASKLVNGAETTGLVAAIAGTNGKIVADSASSVTIDAAGALTNVDIEASKATTVTITAGANSAATFHQVAAEKATTLNVTAGAKNVDMESATGASDLTKVQTATLKTDGHLDFTGVALSDAADITVSGTATTSKLTLDAVGATTLTHDVKLTATGLKNGLATGNIDAGTAKVTLDVSGVTGNVDLKGTTNNTIQGDGGLTLNAKNLAGSLTVGNIGEAATTGAISVDATNIGKALSLGTLTTKGDVTVTATNAVSTINVGAITGNNVTVNGQNALGAITNGGITAKSSVNYTGTNLFNNTLAITADGESTAFTATLNGGAKDETFTITGNNTTQTGITVTGNLGAGTNLVTTTLRDSSATAQTVDLSGLTSSATAGDSTGTTATNYETSTVMKADLDANLTFKGSVKDDLVELAGTYTGTISITDATSTDKDMLHLSAATTTSKLTISGIEEITVDGISSINASAISGQKIDITNTAALTLTGTDGNDVVDLSKITTGATAANLVVDLGAGNDTIVLGTGAQTVKFAASAALNGVDTITGFAKATDKIDLSAFAKAGGGAGAETTLTTGLTTTANVVYQLGGLAAGSADSLAAAAAAINGTATDIAAAAATAWVILSDDNSTSIYEWTDVAGTNGAQVNELTLVGTIDAAMTTGEIATATLIA
ncbi:hypothetical protein NG767_11060 [Aliarcobacter cryaerophilus]|uniref:beta strand repeat-containing protein n=1 Tax=Aliarcobacter cryaerophilus TaxID=28198 RepID=UPI003DA558E6